MMAPWIYFSIFSITVFALSTSAHEHSKVEFGYTGPNGPEQWGSLSPKFEACSKGKAQSPVNIAQASVVWNKKLKPLKRHYIPTNSSLINNKYNIEVRFEGKVGDININGKNYSLKQLHWHSPSEHRANGYKHVAELHLVHYTEDNNNIAVVAILYKLGAPNPLLSKIEDKLIKLGRETHAGNKNATIVLGTFDLKEFNRGSHRYYRYVGSLTTPPCKEGVVWNIISKVRIISKKQLKLLKAPLNQENKKNARPIQPLNGRKIQINY
ncbi:PREDICTED: alpha carbonic anhydrase 1, chloroplastic-like [Lupinus angustifolius]|uniref:alpha carbonic anhydrase 1, chloroplastic-like n=1 Tax=Lupinus angustifolius TaxID=3871 RepID=UPI00092E2FD4|nr:PREDICTED: alpha carbonic anhydrase 1, chloroplastic-like [Lupinus angustifolius]